MKDFLSAHCVFGRDGGQIIFVAQVAMPLAEGVADLSNHHPQFVLRIETEPETHWIEHMTEQARLCQKQNALLSRQILRLQNLPCPSQATPLFRGAAMVAVKQTH